MGKKSEMNRTDGDGRNATTTGSLATRVDGTGLGDPGSYQNTGYSEQDGELRRVGNGPCHGPMYFLRKTIIARTHQPTNHWEIPEKYYIAKPTGGAGFPKTTQGSTSSGLVPRVCPHSCRKEFFDICAMG